MKGFIDFIREQGVIGLAIGFVMGGAVSKLVASFVESIVQPLIGMIFGSTDGLVSWMVGPVLLGDFITVLIDFLIIAAVVYWVFKGLRLDTLDKPKA